VPTHPLSKGDRPLWPNNGVYGTDEYAEKDEVDKVLDDH